MLVEHSAYAPVGVRLERWYDAVGRPAPYAVPWAMVDSGHEAGGGAQDYEAAYRAMIDRALLRPPAAELSAWFEQRGATGIWVEVQVTNRSGAPWTEAHEATVNVIVYERRRMQQTLRFARAAMQQRIGALDDGETGTFRLAAADVPVYDWDRAMVLALVEYRPNPPQARFETLQARHAAEGPPSAETSTATQSPTAAATEVPTETPTESPTPTETSTETPVPTETSTETLVPTEASTELPVLTETPTPAPSPLPTTPPPSPAGPAMTVSPIPTEAGTPMPTVLGISLPLILR